MCHLYSARLPPQCLVELQFWDRLCIDSRIVQQPIMPGFRSQFCLLVKLKFRDCLKHRFRTAKLNANTKTRTSRYNFARQKLSFTTAFHRQAVNTITNCQCVVFIFSPLNLYNRSYGYEFEYQQSPVR